MTAMGQSLEEYMDSAPASARRVAEELRGPRQAAGEARIPAPAACAVPERAAKEKPAAAPGPAVFWKRIQFRDMLRMFAGMLADRWYLGKEHDPYKVAEESFAVYCRSDLLPRNHNAVTTSSQDSVAPKSQA